MVKTQTELTADMMAGELIRVGTFIDLTPEIKNGNKKGTGESYSRNYLHYVVKFHEDEQPVTCSQRFDTAAEIEAAKKLPRPFKIGDRVAVYLKSWSTVDFQTRVSVKEVHGLK